MMPFVQAGDVRLHYVEHGTGAEPLVFVHGYTSSHRNWAPLFTRLPARYRAYFLDLRGAGESEKPGPNESGRKPYAPATYAEDIDIATRALGLDTFTLIGHSMGGVTAMQFAVDYPERLRRLVLVAPAPSGGIISDPALRDQMRAIRHNRDLRRQVSRALAVRPTPDDVIDRRIDDELKWPEHALDEAWQGMADARLADAIAGIQLPTLMVVGDRDGLRPANLADAARIPACALQVFYRVGHEVYADVPDEFMSVLDEFVQHGAAAPVSVEERRAMLEKFTAKV